MPGSSTVALRLLSAETAVRGYGLTGQREFLEPYEEAIDEIPASLNELNQLVADNPWQTQQIQHIQSSVTARLATLEQNLRFIKAQSETASQQPELTPPWVEDRQIKEQLVSAIDTFLAEEERLQVERNAVLAGQRRLIWLILGIATAIGIGGSIVVMCFMNRLEHRLAERERNLEENQARLQRVNRSLRTISECNQILVRASDEPALLRDICRVIVEFGGYRATWIGFVDSDEESDEAQRIRLVAQAGFSDADLNSTEVICSDTRSGRSFTSAAIRTRQVCIEQNILDDPTPSAHCGWREEALQQGYASCIALPLMVNNLPIGVLTIYATQPNVFDQEAVRLLIELADDLAYGIAALRTQIGHQEAEEALRQSEEHLRSVLQNMPVMLDVFDAEGNIVVWNQECERVTGFLAEEVVGNPKVIERMYPDARYLRQMMTAWAGRGSNYRNWEWDITCKDGRVKTIAWSNISALFPIPGWLNWGIGVDVTDRKRAEEALRQANQDLEARVAERTTTLSQMSDRLQLELIERERTQEILEEQAQLLDLAHDTILALNMSNVITFWNHGAEVMYGWTKAEALGKNAHELLQMQFLRPLAEIEAEFLKIGYWEGESIHTKRDGTTVVVASRWALRRDSQGRPIEILKISNDITQRKQAEEQLRLGSERISLANAELARAARLKDEFLAGMSHELRTPLNAILGLTEALQEEVYGGLTQKQKESLNTIEQSGKHLLELINDILDLSKIESGKMELEVSPVSVMNLCENSLNFVKQQAHGKSIKLTCQISDELTEVEVDERRIRQVLVNLLSNAVKFTPEGGKVQLQVIADSFRATIQFSITDNGIGIAPENMDKLFRPFIQLDSSLSRRYAGTGLGLVLVRRITELHGGSVTLESELGKGSRFTVNLPWIVSDRPTSQTMHEALSALALPSVNQALIVEDSEIAANQVARYLQEIGAKTLIHPLGEGVLDAIQQSQPSVIILDLLLPDQSGLDVLAALKANPLTQSIPVIVISVIDERSRCLELAASEYILKPISRQKFQYALRRAMTEPRSSMEQTALIVTQTKPSQSPLILLAEDNEANITTITDYLQAHGLQVALARNGLEAVHMAKQQSPDLILMDIQMPEMDGLEATRRIRSEVTTEVPIIALTALAMPGDREQCLAAGATEYITKPVSLKQLANVIAKYLPNSNDRQRSQ
ncbi:MAG: response regulator [Cyanobacteria bacterium CRU_2_1]|nr:response regulator [Cyanobacteria bacterium CRU_2_1]